MCASASRSARESSLWKLCGVKAREYTNATSTGLVNAQTGEYDPEILQALGLPETMFPKLTAPGTVLVVAVASEGRAFISIKQNVAIKPTRRFSIMLVETKAHVGVFAIALGAYLTRISASSATPVPAILTFPKRNPP